MKTLVEIGNEMLSAKTEPMSKDVSHFLALMLSTNEDEWNEKIFSDTNVPFALAMLFKRLKFMNVVAEKRAIIFVAGLTNRAGAIVLYAAAMKSIFIKNNSMVTLNDICWNFPFGFPTESEIHRIWDGQKIHDGKFSDNMVDRTNE